MDALIESTYRFYPAAALMLTGGAVTVAGLRRWRVTLGMPATDPAKSLAMMQAFRVLIIGLAFAALALAWMGQVLWLAVLALAVGGEETFESTMAIGAMRYGRPRQPAPRRSAQRHHA